MTYLTKENIIHSFQELTNNSNVYFLNQEEEILLTKYLDKLINNKYVTEIGICKSLDNQKPISQITTTPTTLYNKVVLALTQVETNPTTFNNNHHKTVLKLLEINLQKHLVIKHLQEILQQEDQTTTLTKIDSDLKLLEAVYTNTQETKIQEYIATRTLGEDLIIDRFVIKYNTPNNNKTLTRDIAIYELLLLDIKILEILLAKEVNIITQGIPQVDFGCCVYSYQEKITKFLQVKLDTLEEVITLTVRTINTKKKNLDYYLNQEKIVLDLNNNPIIQEGYTPTANQLYNTIPTNIIQGSDYDLTLIDYTITNETGVINPITSIMKSQATIKLYQLETTINQTTNQICNDTNNQTTLNNITTNIDIDPTKDNLEEIHQNIRLLPTLTRNIQDSYKDINNTTQYLLKKRPTPQPENQTQYTNTLTKDRNLLERLETNILDYNNSISNLNNKLNTLKQKLRNFKTITRDNTQILNNLLEDVEAISNTIGKYLCEGTKIKCLITSAIGTITKTASNIGSSVLNVFKSFHDTKDKYDDLQIKAKVQITNNVDTNFNSYVEEQLNIAGKQSTTNYSTDSLVQEEIDQAVNQAIQDTLDDNLSNNYLDSMIDCEFLDSDTRVGAIVENYFKDTLNTQSSCDGEALFKEIELLNLNLEDLLLNFKLDIDLNLPNCKEI